MGNHQLNRRADGSTSNRENPLESWLAGDPIHPRTVSDWEHLRQWSRRRPIVARVVAMSVLATILLATISTTMLFVVHGAHRQAELALALTEQEQRDTLLELQSARELVRQRDQEAHQAVESCRSTLSELSKAEESLDDLQRRYDAISQGREQIESAARLALAREMAAESAHRLATQPAQSLLLAERAMTYLSSQGEPAGAELEQTLRDALAASGEQVLRGHSGPVEVVCVNESGRWLLTGSVDKTVRLWDLHDGASEEARVLEGHKSPVRLGKISPDSHWAVTIDAGNLAILWDLRSSDPEGSKRVLPAHQGKIYDLAISSDSRWLAIAGTGAFQEEDNSVRLWDLKSLSRGDGEPASSENSDGDSTRAGQPSFVLRGHNGPVLAVAITPDCRWVVTGSDDETVRLFDLTSHCPAASQVVLHQHSGPVTSIAVSADGRWMATGSDDRTVRLWDLTVAQPGSRSTVLEGHEAAVHTVAISATGRWVATAAHDHTVRLWDMNAVDPTSSCVVLTGHESNVGPVLFGPDGRSLIAGCDDGTARVWDVEATDPAADPVILRGHCGPVAALAVTPDGRKILTGCRAAAEQTDCLVRMWDVPIEEVVRKARPVVARRMDAGEQEQVLLEAAHHADQESQDQAGLR